MQKIYYLHTCSTCQRIMKELDLTGFVQQEIKTTPITAVQLEEMKERTGSYAALFSKRAMKYRQLGLHEQQLTEDDYRDWILKEYTFLQRPVILIDNDIFVGNSKKVIAAAAEKIAGR